MNSLSATAVVIPPVLVGDQQATRGWLLLQPRRNKGADFHPCVFQSSRVAVLRRVQVHSVGTANALNDHGGEQRIVRDANRCPLPRILASIREDDL